MSDQTLKGLVRPSDTRPEIIDYIEDGRGIPFRVHITDRNGWADDCRDGDNFATLCPPSDDDWQQKYAWAKLHREEITVLVIEHVRRAFPTSKITSSESGLESAKLSDGCRKHASLVMQFLPISLSKLAGAVFAVRQATILVVLLTSCRGAIFAAENSPAPDTESPRPRHWTYISSQRSAWYGFSFATGGDLNRDGFPDLVVGVPRLAEKGTRTGGFAVFFGGPKGPGNEPVDVTRGRWGDVRFGDSLCGILDFNHDGYGDILVENPPNAPADSKDAGVILYAGSAPGGRLKEVAKRFFRVPHQPRELCASKAGDLNGDGFQDIIVAVLTGSHVSNALSTIWPVYGSSTGLVWQTAKQITNWGEVFAGAGDVNGDGFDDLISGNGTLTNLDNPASVGVASIYLGSHSGLSVTSSWRIVGAETHERIGHVVAGIGDVNNDGFSDIAVGATGRNPKTDGLGRVYVYLGSPLGPLKTPAWMMTAESPGSYFGRSVVGLGDVNGDKFGDVLVGAVYANAGHDREGRVYLYLGATNGLEATPRLIIDGGQPNAQFGFALASAGDIDQDGLNDFLIGSPYYGNSPAQAGRVDLFFGSQVAYQEPLHLVVKDRNFIPVRKETLVIAPDSMSGNQSGPQVLPPAKPSPEFPWPTLSVSIAAFGAVSLLVLRKHRAAVVMRERERIARDLHDEVGAHLTNLAMIGRATQTSETEKLQEVSLATREITRAFEQAVWAVRPENDTLENFISFIGAQSPKFFNGSPTRCLVDLPVTVPERKLSENVRKQLLPTVKEALNNAAKHARASEVWLRIQVGATTLRIVVEDNGCGLPLSGVKTAPNTDFVSTSRGITNMKRRISEIGGDFSIENRSGGGTRVVIQARI